MLFIIVFFLAHWYLSLFFQTFFLHRYAAHSMFTMNKFWERFFHLGTFIAQGSSYLNPRGYAILHRMHHAYSDTEDDPHSPHFFPNFVLMMKHTFDIFNDINDGRREPEKRFEGGYPEWKLIDKYGSSWPGRVAWGAAYFMVYYTYAPSPWFYLLVPVHFLMGPIHGAIVNWCGHKYGYRNYEIKDHSKNTLHFDFVTMGELFQNNHHRYPLRPNFATRWFEIDPTYGAIRVLSALKIIKMTDKSPPSLKREKEKEPVEAGAA